MLNIINDELEAMIDEGILVALKSSWIRQPRVRDVTYCDFASCQPPMFEGEDSILSI